MAEFVRGIKVDKPSDKAKDFLVCKIALSPEIIDLYEKEKNEGGWLNIDVKKAEDEKSKEEYYYWTKNDWTPDSSKNKEKSEEKGESINSDEIPF